MKELSELAESVEEEIRNLISSHEILLKTWEIYTSNAQLKNGRDHTFFNWIKVWANRDMIMRIGCLIDNDEKSNSLVNLLKSLMKEKCLKGQSINELHADIECLNNITMSIKKFRNKSVAHLNKKKNIQTPTYTDIDDSIKLIERIGKEYLKESPGRSPGLRGTRQSQWMDVFKISWLPPNNE